MFTFAANSQNAAWSTFNYVSTPPNGITLPNYPLNAGIRWHKFIPILKYLVKDDNLPLSGLIITIGNDRLSGATCSIRDAQQHANAGCQNILYFPAYCDISWSVARMTGCPDLYVNMANAPYRHFSQPVSLTTYKLAQGLEQWLVSFLLVALCPIKTRQEFTPLWLLQLT